MRYTIEHIPNLEADTGSYNVVDTFRNRRAVAIFMYGGSFIQLGRDARLAAQGRAWELNDPEAYAAMVEDLKAAGKRLNSKVCGI